MYANILILAAGVYLALISMWMETENMRSFVLFRAVPFLLGLGTILIAVKQFGWLN